MCIKNKVKQWAIPLFVLIVCFIVIVLSISQIINMIRPQMIASTTKLHNEQYYSQVTALIQNSSVLDYKTVKTKLLAAPVPQSALGVKFNIDPQVEKLPPAEQNYIIRLKLIEWKLAQFQIQIEQLTSASSEVLLSKISFWIASLFIWISSTIGGRILIFLSDTYIIKKYWVKQSENTQPD